MIEKFNNLNTFENKEKANVKIEIANENDWEDYKKIRLEAIENEPMAFFTTKESKKEEYGRTEEGWKNKLNDLNSFTVICKNKEDPIGMAQVLIINLEKKFWHIRGVYLNKNFRGQDYGNKIMNFIIEEIKDRHGKGVTLNVTDTQEIAEKIYKKLGFETYEKFEPKIVDGVEMPGGKWMFKEL